MTYPRNTDDDIEIDASDRLRQYVERAERLLDEREAIQADIADVMSEAKSVGFDIKTIRLVIRLRATEKAARDEAEALLKVYKKALGLS